jgi:hypothetical protein
LFIDTIDSIALQKIVDTYHAYTTDIVFASDSTAITGVVSNYAATTSQVKLKYALAYSTVKAALAGTEDYKDYTKTTFDDIMRPEFLWAAMIPFGKTETASGLKNLKDSYDALKAKLAIATALTADIEPLYLTTPTSKIMNSAKFNFVGATDGGDATARATAFNDAGQTTAKK